MPRAPFFYSPDFRLYDMGADHPLQPRRLQRTFELLNAYGLFSTHLDRREPAPADPDEVRETHSRDYLEALRAMDRGQAVSSARRYGFGSGDNPVFPGLYTSSMLYTGASAMAAEAVNGGAGLAFNISGGLHHAHFDRAAGFCVLNDCAVSVRHLRRTHARVAYIDIDVHHGDGVQELFYSDPSVLTISIHESGRTLFPGTGFVNEIGEGEGAGASVNVPLAPYTTDRVWLKAWREAALPLLKAFNPDAVFLQMGTDPHWKDPLAHVALTAQGWVEAVRDVHALGKPIVAVGGGGYNPTTVPRMWTLAIAALLGIELDDKVPLSFEDRHELPTLRDHDAPPVTEAQVRVAELFAETTIAEVKERLFPRWGLAAEPEG